MVTLTIGAAQYTARRELESHALGGRNIIHEVPGRPDPDVVFRPASTRSGTLLLRLDTYAAAHALAEALATATVVSLVDPDSPLDDMSFVVSGDLQVMPEPVARVAGFVHVPYRRVLT